MESTHLHIREHKKLKLFDDFLTRKLSSHESTLHKALTDGILLKYILCGRPSVSF
mgnify:CR=1 FL=1